MSRQGRFHAFLVATIALCALVLPGVSSGQDRFRDAFERIREIQERHTERLMARAGVVGTAVGFNERGNSALLVFLEDSDTTGLPKQLDGIPVEPIVTGTIYALAEPAQLQWWRSPPRDRTPPAAPTGLKAVSAGTSRIDLTWNKNSETDLNRYYVYRSQVDGGPYTRIGSVSKMTQPKYSDTGLKTATIYFYVVTAIDTAGNQSAYSSQASATTQGESSEPSIGPRPAPIGVSTGHPSVTAGTIGCRVKDSSGKLYALSNNHVYANENRASIGDNVLQPGVYDGGQNPRDAIGTLTAFQQITFSRYANNTIDAAIALCPLANLSNSTPAGSYGIPSITTVPAAVNLTVKKHGRTTGLTSGQVYAVNATVNVTYDSGVARFVKQIVITPGTFSAGGDSGSLIVTESGNHPVGLLFAGSSSYTIANPIDPVLSRFGVTIDGQP
jgi:hypothetical protein